MFKFQRFVKKLIITHFLLNLYLVVMIAPAFPIMEYLINYDYIANELCENKDKPLLGCNGKCYLEKQVKKQLHLDDNQKEQTPPKVDFEKFITLKTKKFDYSFLDQIKNQERPVFNNRLKEISFINSLLRPPRQLS